MVAYAWNAEQTDAFPVPDGVRDALETGHDIPEASQCAECHGGMADVLIGVSALQLDHDLDGVTIGTLAAAGALSDPPSARLEIPGDDTARAALGYLHANCGNCHNERNQYLPLRLWLTAAALEEVETTDTYTTSVGVSTSTDPLSGTDATQIIVPGDPLQSLLYLRMSRRGDGGMPRLGTEIVDAAATAAIGAWIESL
jgi:mono/diheme cytochrome c family protein